MTLAFGEPVPHFTLHALDAVLAGEEPERAETRPVGCSIKWRS